MDKTVDLIKKDISKAFGKNRIISLLFFGTRAFDININKFSDYDLLLMLDDYKKKDPFDLKRITDSPPLKDTDINLSLVYKSDIETRGINNFQLRTLKLDFCKYLSEAKVLIGKNYFKENPVIISIADIKTCADFKIQEFYGRCDKLYVSLTPNKKLTNQVRKYTREILRYILISEGKMSLTDIKETKYKSLYKIAYDNNYVSKNDVSNLTSDNLIGIESARRNIYLKYLEIFYTNINS